MGNFMNRVIVVGAGPAGLSLAMQLARAGRPVSLIEGRRDFARGLRGDALMPSGLEALAQMGVWPLLEPLPQRPLSGWAVWLEGRLLFQVPEPMGALQGCRLVRQQALLEALLAEALRHPNFDWQPGRSVSELLRHNGRVSGVAFRDGGQLEAALVIGCDGRDSALRRAAELKLVPRGTPLDLLWFQLPAPAEPAMGGDFMTLVGGGAIASACRGATGDLQLGWLLPPNADSTPQRAASAWAEAFARLAPPALAADLRQRADQLSRPQRFTVQVGQVGRWWQPGLLLLGDAAHPMSPIRAQGINLALRDSVVAARELLQASDLDRACARIERLRRPEISRLQALQLQEAQQGHWIGHTPWLRHGLARLSPVAGPAVARIWRARQRPLREGTLWL